MRPSLFFAIFIPILAIIVNTLVIINMKKKDTNPRAIKIVFTITFLGVIVLTYLITTHLN